ncbi:NAD-dependent epimerase/dehydratase family protein [Bailinhaonella thermotolerans]|nr:NAD-dependent epimerase/dehydratase family protein [Bailinhaonella thermotolerans]
MVTGVAGFIGSHLAEALVAGGHEVIGVDRRPPKDPLVRQNLVGLLDHPRFRYEPVDIADGAMLRLLMPVQVVFHLAAATGVRSSWGERFREYASSNVLGTQMLLEYCATVGVPRMVLASSSSVYGEAVVLPMREEGPVWPLSPYGVTKLAAEQLALAYALQDDAPTSVVALRYFTVYGPRQRPDMVIARMFQAVLTGTPVEVYGDGSQRRSFTYVDDVVRATVRAATMEAHAEVINIAGDQSTSLAELRNLIEQVTGQPVPTLARGRHLGDVAATEGDNGKAEHVLDYHPLTPLAEGLARQWRWLIAHPNPSLLVLPGRTS